MKLSRILIAEDSRISRKLLVAMIGQLLDGVEVIEAENGCQAVELFEQRAPDLVLLDVNMPLLDGLDAAREIRCREQSLNRERLVPLIAVTASVLPSDQQRCFDAGMNEFLTKPVQFKQLEQILNKYSV